MVQKKSKAETLQEMIRGQLPAKVIMKKSGYSLMTIQKHVGVLQAMDKKFYDIEGLWEKPGNIRFAGLGITIHRAKLIGGSFKSGDEFTHEFDDNTITLTKIQQ
jgi:hypothetical protein